MTVRRKRDNSDWTPMATNYSRQLNRDQLGRMCVTSTMAYVRWRHLTHQLVTIACEIQMPFCHKLAPPMFD